MGYIKLLDDITINKIAAGEVIERPASIVKELVENSIDAGSKEITVEVKDGGISFIRITDNGSGISADEMKTAFLRHATSKIKNEIDLNFINTLGFRGEALASIAAISKVEMMSKKAEEPDGSRLYLEGGKIVNEEPCGSPCGTVITVKNVFFNTPARLKFLKTQSREGLAITDYMQNLSMSHTEISFKYKLNDKLIFLTRGDGDLKAVILSLYGKEFINNIIEANCYDNFISVKGFIGNSNISKGSRNYQSIFINGRYVKNKTITAAVENAYKSMLTINKFPFFVLHLTMNPEFVDVNVHPSKAEVKFQDDQLVFRAVYSCIKEKLVNYSPLVQKETNFSINIPEANYIQEEIKQDFSIINKDNAVFENSGNNKVSTDDSYKKNNYNEPDTQANAEKSDIHTENCTVSKTSEEKINSCEISNAPKFNPLVVIGQIHFTYIVAEDSEDMFLIDQHAAHERIWYEKLLKDYNNTTVQIQDLLTPIVLNLSPVEKHIVFENINIFNKIGYNIEDFGGNSISIRSVPMLFGNPDTQKLFYDMLNQISIKGLEYSSVIDRVIYTMACKSAVKAGDKLNYKEMTELIDKLRYCDNPFNCPHGRPTIIKMSYTELEKKFKRIQ